MRRAVAWHTSDGEKGLWKEPTFRLGMSDASRVRSRNANEGQLKYAVQRVRMEWSTVVAGNQTTPNTDVQNSERSRKARTVLCAARVFASGKNGFGLSLLPMDSRFQHLMVSGAGRMRFWLSVASLPEARRWTWSTPPQTSHRRRAGSSFSQTEPEMRLRGGILHLWFFPQKQIYYCSNIPPSRYSLAI